MNSFLKRIRRKIKRSNLSLQLFDLIGEELQPEKWVFILGCYNSGTTLLSQTLSHHPEISGLPDEGIAYTNRLPHPELFGWPRMWIKCLEEMSEANSKLTDEDAATIKKQWSFWYENEKPVLVEKSISDVTRIEYLMYHFSPAYFICLIRNGYAVAEGIQRRAKLRKWGNEQFDNSYPIELCAEQWLETYQLIDQKKGEIPNYTEVTYESFTEDPYTTLERITSFLDLPSFSEEIIEQRWKLQDRNKPITNMNAQSFKRLSDREISKIKEVAGKELEKRGYLDSIKIHS